jgi:AcrR family transcriptional regulator
MGINERKARQKEELREQILEAAKKLFLEKGIEHTTIRSIAAEIEYSVGTVYLYYQHKNEILHDLHQNGFRQLGGEMRVLTNVSDPMERLKALGRVYIRFAVENPEMYDLMFNMKAPMDFIESSHKEDWNEGKATFDVLRQNVAACMETGKFKGHQLEPLAFAIWSAVHGMASLHIGERVKGVNLENPEGMIFKAYEEIIMLMEK